MAFVFIGHSAPDLLLDLKVDSKQTPVPRIAIVHSKTKRTESVQPKMENRGQLPWLRRIRLSLLVPRQATIGA